MRQSEAERVVATILLRDAFRIERHYFLIRVLIALAVLAGIAAHTALGVLDRPTVYRYVEVAQDGRLVRRVPLALENHDEDFVVRWTVDRVSRLYTFDFANLRSQLQPLRDSMTKRGWTGFQDMMQVSGNLKLVKDRSMVVSAAPVSGARVVKKGVFNGRMAWKIQFPMVVTFQNSRAKNRTTADLTVTVTVVRMSENMQPDGLGIHAIIAE